MILIRCVNAYAAVQGMMNKEWDYQTAYELVMLRKKLYPHVSYYQQEEMKLVQAHAARDKNGKILWTGEGAFSFQSPEDGESYAEKRRQLGMVETQGDFKPVKLPAPRMIRPDALDALEGFVEFVEVTEDAS